MSKAKPNFGAYPADRQSFCIIGGTLATRVANVTKSAKLRDWDFRYGDVAFAKSTTEWRPGATEGQVLLPKHGFVNTPTNFCASNYFAAEAFGNRFILVKLDPTKGHRLLIQGFGSGEVVSFTPAYIGSKVEVGGRLLERKSDGCYQVRKKVNN